MFFPWSRGPGTSTKLGIALTIRLHVFSLALSSSELTCGDKVKNVLTKEETHFPSHIGLIWIYHVRDRDCHHDAN